MMKYLLNLLTILLILGLGLFNIFLHKHNIKAIHATKYKETSSKCMEYFPSSELLGMQAGAPPENEALELSRIQYIKQQILGPSTDFQNINSFSTKQVHFSEAGQSEIVDKILHQRKNGFFVECGAGNGIGSSNSLSFERSRNWTGLLVEANPVLFRELLQNNRKCYQLNACLSPTKEPKEMKFKPVGLMGGLSDFIDTYKETVEEQMKGKSEVYVQCYSLYNIMQALGRNHIDYLSLDVEGAEMHVLKTIPWEKLRIDVLTVEYNMSREKLTKLKSYMESTGFYKFKMVLPHPQLREGTSDIERRGLDAVFVRK